MIMKKDKVKTVMKQKEKKSHRQGFDYQIPSCHILAARVFIEFHSALTRDSEVLILGAGAAIYYYPVPSR